MMRLAAMVATIGLFVFSQTANTADKKSDMALSPSDLSLIRTLSPLPALPIDTTNKYADSPTTAMLGQKLFLIPAYPGRYRRARRRTANSARLAKPVRLPALLNE
jgi:cytochrome c peroxidase